MSREPGRVVESVDTGVAELVSDRDGGWTLLVDGVEQSYVHPAHPDRLGFSYLRHLAAVLTSVAATRVPQRVLHLGGGAMSLARFVHAHWPRTTQVVVEHDRALAALIARALPLPDEAKVDVRVDDARAFVAATTDRFDVVIADVYQGAAMPGSVSSVQFVAAVAAILEPHGVLAVNVTDLPPLTESRVLVATLRAVFPRVWLIAESAMLRERRYGNVVLVAGQTADALAVPMLRRLVNTAAPRTRVLTGAELDRFVGATGPRVEA